MTDDNERRDGCDEHLTTFPMGDECPDCNPHMMRPRDTSPVPMAGGTPDAFEAGEPAGSDDVQPMSPERLDSIRQHVAGGGDGLCKGEARDLLADRDRLAAQAKTLARALLAWKRIGDRGFGDPGDWDCYEYRGWKLDMSGCEEFFTTEFEAVAVKTACVNARGLAEAILSGADS